MRQAAGQDGSESLVAAAGAAADELIASAAVAEAGNDKGAAGLAAGEQRGAAEAAAGGQQQSLGHNGSGSGQAGEALAPLGDALDVGRMQQAAAFFLGEHDFRNFCKVRCACWPPAAAL